MSAWLCIPSAKPVAEAQLCVLAWRDQNYRVALWRDQEDAVDCDMKLVGKYPGYAGACNALVRELLAHEPQARWFVCAGDDMLPDPTRTADEIAAECEAHFRGTRGVMQPTGDGYGAETIAGSAFIGREWCERAYGGNGPFWPEYTHCFLDNELKEVATLTGTFWQRPDLRHKHNHWGRMGKPMPRYLAEANSPQHWERFQRLYMNRRAMNFPGHEIIPTEVAA